MASCSWARLPAEVRLLILQTIAGDPGDSKIGKKNRLAHYASVSKEWQEVFERKIFHRLQLSQSCLVEFGEIVRHQRRFVKHIWLCIQLCTYYGAKRAAERDSKSFTTRKSPEKLSGNYLLSLVLGGGMATGATGV